MPGYADFLDAFVKKMELDSFFLAGNSLGGLISWYYAAQHSGRVKKLVLLNAAGFERGDDPPLVMRLARNPLISQFLMKITPRFLFERSLREVYAEEDKLEEETIQRYFELMLHEGNREAFARRARETEQVDTALLSRLNMPTLIIWGDKDRWISPHYAGQFDRAIPQSRVIMYEGVGHVPMEEIPERSAADVRQFLAGEPVDASN
ncbi:MAG: alpha/beta hydrolase [Saprospiraceae bacterium]|nr:alpha/beta hydrolase [Saprospiraceae bacterium]